MNRPGGWPTKIYLHACPYAGSGAPPPRWWLLAAAFRRSPWLASEPETKRRKKPADSPEAIDRFGRLSAALSTAGIQMRVEPGNFRGGFCLVDGNQELLYAGTGKFIYMPVLNRSISK